MAVTYSANGSSIELMAVTYRDNGSNIQC
jgi:hypothetical protein